MNLAFTEGMGARLLLISITITELAAYVIMGTIYLFMCWDFLLIKEWLDSSLEITLTYSPTHWQHSIDVKRSAKGVLLR